MEYSEIQKKAKEIFDDILIPKNEMEEVLFTSIETAIKSQIETDIDNVDDLTEKIFSAIYMALNSNIPLEDALVKEDLFGYDELIKIAIDAFVEYVLFEGEYGEILYSTIVEAYPYLDEDEIDEIYLEVKKLGAEKIDSLT